MTPIRITSRVSVVLKQVNVAADTFVDESTLRIKEEILENKLPSPVMGHQLAQPITLSGGVFRV
ncbi:hypothetical protein GCM10011410_03180 [Hoyosella rhizosphaerae]|uniref:Uncharacterized protein n=1 Tax=Hoyosella rhizosphaerae TaxID=1755582 RepID=A0A916X8A4_9ACTN|nr:hypothetical protein GCM10011410_03180 [Hoyosella rhizosphaerae]